MARPRGGSGAAAAASAPPPGGGRASGGVKSYMPGDVTQSIFAMFHAMSLREREELYGGPVVLIGIVEARNVIAADVTGTSDPYVVAQPVDARGRLLAAEKLRTAKHMRTLNPVWDEVFTFGQAVHLSEVAAFQFRVYDWDAIGSDDDLGVVTLEMDRMFGDDPNAVIDTWVKLKLVKGMSTVRGEIHLMAVYHSSTDPIPLSLRVNVASAEGLLALTKRGSNSYCTVVPVNRRGGEVLSEKVKTGIIEHTTHPRWNFVVDFGAKCKLSLVKSILIKVKHKRKYLPGYRNLGEVSISLSDLFGEESPVVRGNSYKVRAFVWPLQRRKLRASCVKVNKWYDLLTRTSRRQRVRATGRLLVEVESLFDFDLPMDDEDAASVGRARVPSEDAAAAMEAAAAARAGGAAEWHRMRRMRTQSVDVGHHGRGVFEAMDDALSRIVAAHPAGGTAGAAQAGGGRAGGAGAGAAGGGGGGGGSGLTSAAPSFRDDRRDRVRRLARADSSAALPTSHEPAASSGDGSGGAGATSGASTRHGVSRRSDSEGGSGDEPGAAGLVPASARHPPPTGAPGTPTRRPSVSRGPPPPPPPPPPVHDSDDMAPLTVPRSGSLSAFAALPAPPAGGARRGTDGAGAPAALSSPRRGGSVDGRAQSDSPRVTSEPPSLAPAGGASGHAPLAMALVTPPTRGARGDAPAASRAGPVRAKSNVDARARGGDDEEEEEEDEEDEEARAAAVAAAEAAADASWVGSDAAERAGDIEGGPGLEDGDYKRLHTSTDAAARAAEFYAQMKRAKEAKVAAMTPEERARFVAEKAARDRQDKRKLRMCTTQLSKYGTSVAKASARGGRGGRGRGTGASRRSAMHRTQSQGEMELSTALA